MAWIKAFKGFDKDMKCRGMQFEEGKEYEEQEAKLCKKGFHACENPLDALHYYEPGAGSIYREVELDATDEKAEDSKRCGKRIKIGARLDVAGICKAHFEYVKSQCDPVAGRVGGDKESVSVGDKASAAAGYRGSAAAGNYGSAAAGESGSAISRGASSVGPNGLACARGKHVKVRGGLGAVLVIAEENADDYDIYKWAAAVVDGEKIKADTWYELKDGEFTEVEANENHEA